MKEFESLDALKAYITSSTINEIAVQDLHLNDIEDTILNTTFEDCIFLGCDMNDRIFSHLSKQNFIFQDLNVPFNAYPNRLYNKDSLYKNYDYKRPETYNNTLDKKIYDHYIAKGKVASSIKETLVRRLHDHSITDAIYDFLSPYPEKKVVAIMGGHGLRRDSSGFKQVSQIAKTLTEAGYLMVSGGGPGAMEATHLGAYFAGNSIEELNAAIDILSSAPKYDHRNWLPTAFEVIHNFSEPQYKSLGIPTWLYGHEPPTPFATHIGKYFANSVREEGLLAIAKGGVIFSPGSAGTMQEIFQDIAQNHYESFGYASPMLFLNRKYWSYDRPVYPIIELMKLRGDLKNLNIGVYDTNEEVIDHLSSFV